MIHSLQSLNRMRSLLALLALAAGCQQEQTVVSEEDLSVGARDLGSPPDLGSADLAAARGWTQVFAASGLRFNAVWGSGAADVYAVGLQGTIFHSAGDDVWTQQKTGRMYELTSVAGSGASDVYAVESESVLHSTGTGAWSVVPSIKPEGAGTLRQVHVVTPSRLYFSGGTGRSVPAYPTGGANIQRWDQSTLMREFAVAEHSIGGLRGSDANDLWAVGSFAQGGGILGLVLHSTGDGTWTRQRFEPDLGTLYLGTLTAVWSSSKTDVYAASGYNAVGSSSGIFRCSGRGTNWRQETDKANPPNIYALWGSGPTDVWAVGYIKEGPNYNGIVLRSKGDGSWAPDPDLPAAKLVGLPLYGVWGSRYGDVYIVGQSGVILHKRE